MKYDLASRLKEQKLEECVQNLLHHFIIFLLRTQEILQHLDQVRRSDMLPNFIITADSSYKHYTLQHDIILGISVDEVVVKELNEVRSVHNFIPLVSVHVNHCAEQLNLQVSVFTTMLGHYNVLF